MSGDVPMELTDLIAALSNPTAYHDAGDAVVVHQTHISVVFLTGPYAYKIKKPVDLGFVDYSTLAKRRHLCDREVILNQRLAPSVYLGVVPVALDGTAVKVDGPGAAIEWAVKMKRLPEEATLRSKLQRGEIGVSEVENLAIRVAAFHARAESGSDISRSGRFDEVARNARENIEQTAARVGTTISRSVFERLRRLTEASLAQYRQLIDARAARGVPRDTHGDLRLGHVYFFPEQPPPDDLIIVDCIEFADRFRHADPVSDVAFLVMDLAHHGRRDLGRVLADAYFRSSGDTEGRLLLPFYAAYRAAVRGKVQGLKYEEPEVPQVDRATALGESRAHWLLALGELEDAARRPCLVLLGGLPGTGKSTLAHGLAGHGSFAMVRSDLVRKELAGLRPVHGMPVPYGEGIYSAEFTDRTYAECSRRVEKLLFDGQRVVMDASFGREANRRHFLELARRWGVPAVFLHCRAEPALIRERLKSRRHDVSDADWSIYQRAAIQWEEPGLATRRATWEIDTAEEPEVVLSRSRDVLRELGLDG
jgi:aminoglycoside phosphotransferase family enzyme/predicted kinase